MLPELWNHRPRREEQPEVGCHIEICVMRDKENPISQVYGKSDSSYPERYDIKVKVSSLVRHTA